MNYKLFDDFITLQAILKELGIIQSGGAIKAFLQEKEVFVNGELEQRRGRKLRVNDQIDIPELSMTITILEPSQEEIEEHLKEKEEKERVAKLVKQLNQQQKKQPTKTNKKRKSNSLSWYLVMWLKQLSIQHFRNYQELEVEFHPGLNIFLGQNAQGKTNILESIYFLALTRSHRTRNDRDLIYFESTDFKVSGQLQRETGPLPLEISLTPKGRITKVNHLKQAKLSNYIGHMNVVLFAPEDLQLIKGSPAGRRKFIDIELGQMKPLYLSDLSQYNHVLKQRNSYLKNSEKIDATFLEVLDSQLASFGSRVIHHRLEFIKKLEAKAKEKHTRLSDNKEDLSIQYQSTVFSEEGNDIEEQFLSMLEKNRQKDIFRKTTSIGPHRDDLAFFINNMNATFGSQGQHRSVVLSLKLAEIELMEEITREKPILLLDDVMSELDNYRQLQLLETISNNIQTFITTTTLDHLKELPEELKIFTVQAGHIKTAS